MDYEPGTLQFAEITNPVHCVLLPPMSSCNDGDAPTNETSGVGNANAEAHKTYAQPDQMEVQSQRILGLNHDEVVHDFLAAAEKGRLPRGPQLREWLTSRFNAQAFHHFLYACAHAACPMCRAGYELCPACHAAGVNGRDICDGCIGFGVSRCSYCGGSGWNSADGFPMGIRCTVMAERVESVVLEMKDLLKPVEHASSDEEISKRRGMLARALLRWNRCLSVIENMILILKSNGDAEGMSDRWRSKMIRQGVRLAEVGLRHIRDILRTKGGNAAESPKNGGKISATEKYYSELAANISRHPDFNHPFIRKAREELIAATVKKKKSSRDRLFDSIRIRRDTIIQKPSPPPRGYGRRGFIAFFAIASMLIFLPTIRADSIRAKGIVDGDLRFTGYSDGNISGTTPQGRKMNWPIEALDAISIDGAPSLAKAEKIVSAGGNVDYRAAAAAYKKAISETNNRQLRVIIQARAITAFDRAGLWLDATTAFSAVLEASPTKKTFLLRPAHFPTEQNLKESAELLAKRIEGMSSNEAKRFAKGFLLEMYVNSKDARAAALTKELGAFAGELSRSMLFRTLDSVYGGHGTSALTNKIEDMIAASRHDDALDEIDSNLATADEDVAIHLFALKAFVLEKEGKYMDAAGAYMRIAAFYSTYQKPASEAVWATAQILEKLHHSRDARNLYREIVDRYPASEHVEAARSKLATK